MALMPKRVKHRKSQRGRIRGNASRGNRVVTGPHRSWKGMFREVKRQQGLDDEQVDQALAAYAEARARLR